MCDCPAHEFIGRECTCQCDHSTEWKAKNEDLDLYLCKFWGLDDLLYVIGDESSLDEWSLNEIAEDSNNIYFLVELSPI